MNKDPSKRPTSPEIPTPSLYLGVAIVVRVERILHNKTNYSEHVLQKTRVRVYLAEISNNEDLKCVYLST